MDHAYPFQGLVRVQDQGRDLDQLQASFLELGDHWVLLVHLELRDPWAPLVHLDYGKSPLEHYQREVPLNWNVGTCPLAPHEGGVA